MQSGAVEEINEERAVSWSVWMDFFLLFVLVPLTCWFFEPPILVVLGASAGILILALWRDPEFLWKSLNKWRVARHEWAEMLLVWLLATAVMLAIVWWHSPDSLFRLPRRHTEFWLSFIALYPITSVVPQEIIYRAYFFRRYRALFRRSETLVLASAIAFAFAHIIMRNSIAVTLTVAAGWLFARSFARTRSLPFVFVQHSLYGCTAFTVGLGRYFYQTNPHSLHTIATMFH